MPKERCDIVRHGHRKYNIRQTRPANHRVDQPAPSLGKVILVRDARDMTIRFKIQFDKTCTVADDPAWQTRATEAVLREIGFRFKDFKPVSWRP